MQLESDGEFPWPPAPRPDQGEALDPDGEDLLQGAQAADGPRVRGRARARGGRRGRHAASVSGRFGAEPGTAGKHAASGAEPGTAGRYAASMSGDRAEPVTAERPLGPGTVDETFQWPLQYARRMETAASGDHWAEVRAKFTRGLRLTTCYSGVGQFEAAASWIEKAMEVTGAWTSGRTRWLQSSDLADRCQRVLLAHGGDQRATPVALSPEAPRAPTALSPAGPRGPCVFGDLLDRRTTEHAAAWAECQRAAAQRVDAAVAAGRGPGGGRVQRFRRSCVGRVSA